MSRVWVGGSTWRWRRTRHQILLANLLTHGGACQLAIPGVCTGSANVVHHTHGRAGTGDDPRYLAAVCAACNRKIGDPSKHIKSDPIGTSATRW